MLKANEILIRRIPEKLRDVVLTSSFTFLPENMFMKSKYQTLFSHIRTSTPCEERHDAVQLALPVSGAEMEVLRVTIEKPVEFALRF
jgi:hypothetical protein